MKIVIMSDSHGKEERVIDIIMSHKDADGFVFLGDGERDFENALAYGDIYPYGEKRKIISQVRGNCDIFSSEAVTLLENFDGVRVLVSHGHDQNVKLGLNRIAMQAREKNCQAALFGHTHSALLEEKEGVMLFNPGSIYSGSYGILIIKDGKCSFEHASVI